MWSEIACPDIKPTYLCAPREFLKKCLSCLIIVQSCYCDYRINLSHVLAAWSAFLALFTWSRRTTRAKDHRLFILITHKSTRSENPITWRKWNVNFPTHLPHGSAAAQHLNTETTIRPENEARGTRGITHEVWWKSHARSHFERNETNEYTTLPEAASVVTHEDFLAVTTDGAIHLKHKSNAGDVQRLSVEAFPVKGLGKRLQSAR